MNYFVIAIALIAVACAIVECIKKDREIWNVRKYYHGVVDSMEEEAEELKRKTKLGEHRIAEQEKKIDRLLDERRELKEIAAESHQKEMRAKADLQEMKEASLMNRMLLTDFKVIEDESGNRTCYMELDGMRLIVDGDKVSGWYDNNVPEKAREDACEAMENGSDTGNTCETPLTNYRWIRRMSVEEMARMIVNFEEMTVLSCDPKYCEGRPSDLQCPPLSDGEDREERCYRATLKWLMDLHAEAETEAGGKEGPGEERQPAEPAEAAEE